ncbi:MAG: DUF4176 domain-containing protein [Lachnospiraceae bacterium]|jgi:hypothetical protein|nr:DUF4176 domain-containing protein [Lachnospiraceae bacterium]
MSENILPLGTVVNLKNGDGTELVIIARGTLTKMNGKTVYYDYGGVLIPEGLSTPENVYFFNRENVKEVIFMGYENDDEKEFQSKYDKLIEEAKVIKGSVNE